MADKIGEAANEITQEVIDFHLEKTGDVKAQEEPITNQLEYTLSKDIIKRIKDKLGGVEFEGINLKIHGYSKYTEEPLIGADFAGYLEIDLGQSKLSKVFLAQAKVGTILNSSVIGNQNLHIVSKDSNVKKQADRMLDVTSDSFFFLYTNRGVYVVPALEVQLLNNISHPYTIDTHFLYYKKIGAFFGEFFKCFIGDHKLAEVYSTPKSFIKEHKVNNVLEIKISKKEKAKS